MKSQDSYRNLSVEYDRISDKVHMSPDHYECLINFSTNILDKASVTLDLGCGQGFLLRALEQSGYRSLVGVDFSKDLLLKARKNKGVLNEFHLVRADLHSLPFRINSVPQVMLCEVIEHVEDPSRVVEEIEDVLTISGRVVLSFPNAFAYYPWYHFFSRIGERNRSRILHAVSPIAMKILIPYEDSARSLQPLDNPFTFFDIKGIFSGFNLAAWSGLPSGTRLRVEGLMRLLGTGFPVFHYRCFLGFSRRGK